MDVPYEPVRWQADVNAGDSEQQRLVKQVHVQSLDQHVPRARPPDRRPRPAVRRAAARCTPSSTPPPTASPCGTSTASSSSTGWRGGHAHPGRGARRPARRLLPHARHRVHAHPGPRPEAVDPAARRGRAHHARSRRAAPRPRPAQRGRGVRALPPHPVRRPEALRPRRGGVDHRGARHRAGGGCRRGHERGRAGHGAPRPAQRARQHRGQVLRRDLPRVRGRPRPRLGPGVGRRQVPQGGHRQVRRPAPGRSSPSRWRRTPRISRRSIPWWRGWCGPSRTCWATTAASTCCRCWSTATPPSPARAWWPRRSSCRSSPATARVGPSTWW